MKMKKILTAVLLAFSAVLLAACGSGKNADGVPNVLKDKYTGYSKVSGYENPFIAGGDELTFDKKENSITNSQGKKTYFTVIPDNELPAQVTGVLSQHASELKGTENFTIIISRHDKHPTREQAEGSYQIALSDGGNTIRVLELRRGYSVENDYYDFTGQAS